MTVRSWVGPERPAAPAGPILALKEAAITIVITGATGPGDAGGIDIPGRQPLCHEVEQAKSFARRDRSPTWWLPL